MVNRPRPVAVERHRGLVNNSGQVGNARLGHRQWPQAQRAFGSQRQPSLAGDQQFQVLAGVEQVAQALRGPQNVLEVVDQQHQREATQPTDNGRGQRFSRKR